jgi:hypothetical protein
LTFNDSGYVLRELVGIPTAEFERKAKGMAKLNLVQQGAELAYLLLHDPEFGARVRREHLYEVGHSPERASLPDSGERHRRLPLRFLYSFGGAGRGCSVCARARWFYHCGVGGQLVSQVAKRTVLSRNALAVLAPIPEEMVGWERLRIREFFESYGMLIQGWDRVRTDWLTLRSAASQLVEEMSTG